MERRRDGDDAGAALAGLTAKQREVLDLVIEHKTSKEIARVLGISPHTVDQRLQFARDKLGAATRSEAAVLYRALVETCGRSTYGSSGLAPAAGTGDRALGAADPLPAPQGSGADFRALPHAFDGRHGTMLRLGAILAIALFIVLVVLGAMAMFAELSRLMAK